MSDERAFEAKDVYAIIEDVSIEFRHRNDDKNFTGSYRAGQKVTPKSEAEQEAMERLARSGRATRSEAQKLKVSKEKSGSDGGDE